MNNTAEIKINALEAFTDHGIMVNVKITNTWRVKLALFFFKLAARAMNIPCHVVIGRRSHAGKITSE